MKSMKSKNSKIAIYPGSFDPITNGHIDIIERALPIFDKIVICVSYSHQKKYLFNLDDRLELVKKCFNKTSKLEVVASEGLTVNVARKHNASYIVRGIRTNLDVEYEKAMDLMNKTLCPDIETVFLFSSSKFSNISSSLVKEVASLNGDVKSFVPDIVLKALKSKLEAKK